MKKYKYLLTERQVFIVDRVLCNTLDLMDSPRFSDFAGQFTTPRDIKEILSLLKVYEEGV